MAVAIVQTASVAGGASASGLITFSGVAIGTAATNRMVVVGATTDDNADFPASATIDYGAGAITMQLTPRGSFGSMSSVIFYADAPTGTTADIVINIGGTVAANASAITVYSVTGGRIHIIGAGAGSTDMDASAPLTTGALTTLTNGGIILSACGASNTSTFTWSANVTESVAEVHTGTYTYGAAHTTTAISATAVTCTGSVNAQDGALAWLAFAPGANANAAFVGTSNLAAQTVFKLSALAALNSVGAFSADGTIQAGAAPLVGTAAFIGASNMLASSTLFSAGKYDETGAIASLSISPDAFTEFEFGLKLDYDNVNTGDSLAFRVYVNGAPVDVYSVTPSLAIAAHAINATVAFAGTGSLTASAQFILRPLAIFSGSGNAAFTGGTIRIIIGRPPGEASDIMQGSGGLRATSKLLMRAVATFAGSGVAIFGANILKFASFAYSASGNQSATAKLLMASAAALAGVGQQSATANLRMSASTAFSGVGSLAADATVGVGPLVASGAFAGAGALIATSIHFSAGRYDETGETTLTIAADAFSEVEFGLKLDFDNAQTGDVLSFKVYSNSSPLDVYSIIPSITVAAHAINATALFTGLGNLAADASISAVSGQVLQATAAFAGIGAFAARTTMLLQPQAALSGLGNLSAAAAATLLSSAVYTGVGSLGPIPPQLQMASNIQFAGSSNLLAAISRYLSLTAEQFSGVGQMLVSARAMLSPTIALQGSGNQSTSPVFRMVASALLSGVGSLQAEITILGAVTQWSGAATFAGVGSFAITPNLLMAANESVAALGLLSATPTLQMRAFANYSAAGSLAASIGLASIGSSAQFVGASSFAIMPQLYMQASSGLAGLGSMSALASLLGQLTASAAYFGTSAFAVTPRLRMATNAAFVGSGLQADSSFLRMRAATTRFAGVGNLNVLASFVLKSAAAFAGTGTARFTADVLRPISVLFAGSSAMTSLARMRLAPNAIYVGLGSLSVSPRQRMAAFSSLFGEGLLFADLTFKTQQIQNSAVFFGSSNLNAIAKMRLRPAVNSFGATGNLSVDVVRFINLSEHVFAGTGYFSAQVQQQMAAFAELRGIGGLRATTIMLHEPLSVTICNLGAAFATGNLNSIISTGSLATEIDYGTIDTEIGCR